MKLFLCTVFAILGTLSASAITASEAYVDRQDAKVANAATNYTDEAIAAIPVPEVPDKVLVYTNSAVKTKDGAKTIGAADVGAVSSNNFTVNSSGEAKLFGTSGALLKIGDVGTGHGDQTSPFDVTIDAYGSIRMRSYAHPTSYKEFIIPFNSGDSGIDYFALRSDIPTSFPWPSVTQRPTNLSGYGITDAYTKAETDAYLSAKRDMTNREFSIGIDFVDMPPALTEPLVEKIAGDWFWTAKNSYGRREAVGSTAEEQPWPTAEAATNATVVYFFDGDTGTDYIVHRADVKSNFALEKDVYTKSQTDAAITNHHDSTKLDKSGGEMTVPLYGGHKIKFIGDGMGSEDGIAIVDASGDVKVLIGVSSGHVSIISPYFYGGEFDGSKVSIGGGYTTLEAGKLTYSGMSLLLQQKPGTLALLSDISNAYTKVETDAAITNAIDHTSTHFSNEVLSVVVDGLSTNITSEVYIAATNACVDLGIDPSLIPQGGTIGTVGGLLLALAGAVTWLKRNKADTSTMNSKFSSVDTALAQKLGASSSITLPSEDWERVCEYINADDRSQTVGNVFYNLVIATAKLSRSTPTPTGLFTLDADGNLVTDSSNVSPDGTVTVEGDLNPDGTYTVEI